MSIQIKIPRGCSAAIAIRPYQNLAGMKMKLDIFNRRSDEEWVDQIDDDDISDIVDHGPVPDLEDSLTCPSCQGCAVVCSC